MGLVVSRLSLHTLTILGRTGFGLAGLLSAIRSLLSPGLAGLPGGFLRSLAGLTLYALIGFAGTVSLLTLTLGVRTSRLAGF